VFSACFASAALGDDSRVLAVSRRVRVRRPNINCAGEAPSRSLGTFLKSSSARNGPVFTCLALVTMDLTIFMILKAVFVRLF